MRFPNTGTGFEVDETWDFKILNGRVMIVLGQPLATLTDFSPRPAPSYHFSDNEDFELYYWEEMHKNMPKHAQMHLWHPITWTSSNKASKSCLCLCLNEEKEASKLLHFQPKKKLGPKRSL